MRKLILKNEDETRAFGLELGASLRKGDIVALIGDLGTGKTALTKYIAEGLGIRETITSPTFTIVQEYRQGRLAPLPLRRVPHRRSGGNVRTGL